jgi:hypothetical protein
MLTKFERRHSNGVNAWVQKFPVGWEYGVGVADDGGAPTVLRHRLTLEEAQAAADGLAHKACDERCGEWVSSGVA